MGDAVPDTGEAHRQASETAGSAAQTILGLSTSDLAGLSVDEITGDKVAITMLMHYYKQLVDENSSLRNDLNTLRTYVDGYRAKKLNASVGAGLQFGGTVFVGFGINLLTVDASKFPGWLMLAGGVIAVILGLYYSLREAGAQ
jgi:hypothetical protein